MRLCVHRLESSFLAQPTGPDKLSHVRKSRGWAHTADLGEGLKVMHYPHSKAPLMIKMNYGFTLGKCLSYVQVMRNILLSIWYTDLDAAHFAHFVINVCTFKFLILVCYRLTYYSGLHPAFWKPLFYQIYLRHACRPQSSQSEEAAVLFAVLHGWEGSNVRN